MAGLNRQRCKTCKQPVIAEGIRGYMGLSFIPFTVLQGKPDVNVFAKGAQVADPSLKTKESDMSSQIYFMGKMMGPGYLQLCGLCCCCGGGGPKNSSKVQEEERAPAEQPAASK